MNTTDIVIRHFGPVFNKEKTVYDNQSIVWICGEFNGHYLSGYIPNIFDISEIDTKKSYKFTVNKISVLEHSNGGRMNKEEYSSIEEYISDPVVKQRCLTHYTKNLLDFSICGDPTRVDYKFYLNYNDQETTVISSKYETVVPQEWYSDVHSETAKILYNANFYKDSQEAISSLDSVDDLFGTRYFPVACFSKDLLEDAKDVCENFKGQSEPLLYEDRVYFGLRIKPSEICYISELYNSGGVILIDHSWDW